MLPTMILQPSDFANFDIELEGPNLLPEDAIEPEIAFADLLALGTAVPVEPGSPGGALLPAGGNTLPVPEPGALAGRELPVPDDSPENVPEQTINPLPIAIQTLAAPATPRGAEILTLTTTPESSPVLRTPIPSIQPLQDLAAAQQAVTRRGPEATLSTIADTLAATPPPVSRSGNPADGLPAAARAIPENVLATEKQRSLPLSAVADTRQIRDPQRSTRAPLPIEAMAERVIAPRDAAAPPITELAPADSARELRPAATPVIATTTTTPAPITTAAPGAAIEVAQANLVQPGAVQVSQPQAQPQVASELPGQGTQLTDRIDVPVRDTAWGEQLGQRQQMMASNKLQTAEIRLTPAELGPLRVQVAIEEGATTVTFQAQHAVTREAIEQALPRLREMLAENGLTLAQADVGEQGVKHGGRDGANDPASVSYGSSDALNEEPHEENAARGPRDSASLVDTFV